ncbi:hypothetical protein, partial [Bacillus thuringiensis]|uniref:hypothetical protein n=1 Tax=Bacillus thuringiensis TaxID=1428 RepID=UPI002FBD43FF
LKWLTANSNKLDGVSLDKGKLSLARLEKDVPEEAKKFSASLYGVRQRFLLFGATYKTKIRICTKKIFLVQILM